MADTARTKAALQALVLTGSAGNISAQTLRDIIVSAVNVKDLSIVSNTLLIGTATDTLTITAFAANTFPARASSGNLVAKSITDFGLSLVDDADAATARTTLGLASGVYTPTLTNVANLDGSTAFQCQYLRVGSVVTVSGKVSVDPTLAATATKLGISLPVASNIGADEDVGGVAFATGIAAQGGGIIGDATNDRAELDWVSADVTNQVMAFTFTYRVI